MKLQAIAIIALAVMSCNNDQTTAETLVKSKASLAPKEVVKPVEIKNPEVKYGIEGFYTGTFMATKFDETKTFFDNKITICIDSMNDKNVFGHSVVAGNSRPFTGTYMKVGGAYEIKASEPGSDKYDGSFTFKITKDKVAEGTWKANDKKLTVTEREYKLDYKKYKYDAAAKLPEDMVGEMMYGSYNEKSEKAEAITKDAIKKNASVVLLKSKDVENMYKADLEVMRNAIYARHGYSFKNPRMRTLFDSYVDWYMPVATDVTDLLTETEKKNVELIKRYEKHATKYYDVFGR